MEPKKGQSFGQALLVALARAVGFGVAEALLEPNVREMLAAQRVQYFHQLFSSDFVRRLIELECIARHNDGRLTSDQGIEYRLLVAEFPEWVVWRRYLPSTQAAY